MINLKSSGRIEIIYRVYLRQIENAESKFNEITHLLESNLPDLDIEYDETTDIYQPIKPENLDAARKRGLLLVEKDGIMFIVMRQLPITIEYEDDPEQIVEDVLSVCGNVFAVVKISREYLTELQAV